MSLLREAAGAIIAVGLATAIAVPKKLELYAAVAFGINWLVVLVHAIPRQSETYFDLTGTMTFVAVTITACAVHANTTHNAVALIRSFLASGLVLLWSVRLGSFLFLRIHATGTDDRFDAIKTRPVRFFSVWTLQGLWAFVTLLPTLLLHVSAAPAADALQWTDVVGVLSWVIGFAIEVVADGQKTAFRTEYKRSGKFISSGLWRYSRHPNYFGEILLWIGMTILCSGQLATWSDVAIASLSPLLVTLLLTRMSGIPLLEHKADVKFGACPKYQQYKRSTNVLIPWFPSGPTINETTPL
ncbi:membrane protein [Achlya hypogyna]|uniref:Membrane protein n=1 Tax=Achlya hypogyna TaxID=1202772 RepID=A0A1V9YCH0_ACHHY|nr:membrane protein [Achlya hypogyna]